MEFPRNLFVKEEKNCEEIEFNSEIIAKKDFQIKIDATTEFEDEEREENDWCIQNEVTNTETSHKTIGYNELKEYCYHECVICLSVFPNSYSLLRHNLTHLCILLGSPGLYQCDDCLVYYTKKAKLKHHIRIEHCKQQNRSSDRRDRTKSLHKCKICFKIFPYKTWHSHMKDVHSERKFECTKCNFSFKAQRYLKRHNLHIHEGLKPNWRSNNLCVPTEGKCQKCPAVLSNKHSLRTHMRNCHSEAVECPICQSTLKSKSYLHTHMKRVHCGNEKVHKCEICSKAFRSKRRVSIHIKNSHVKVKFRCKWCQKVFRSLQSFNDHKQKWAEGQQNTCVK